MLLYHYSCSHVAAAIARSGVLKPGTAWRHYDARLLTHGEPMSGLWRAPAVIWLTDLATPDPEALGLTSRTLDCDRTEYRYTVQRADDMMPWLQFAEWHRANSAWLRVLHDGRQPDRWFVAVLPTPYIERVNLRAKVA
jgi:hypothetical protein